MNAKDIRQYLLMAADKIERFPKQFDFIKICSPVDGDGCGCALGWIGYFAGMRGLPVGIPCQDLFGIDGSEFYRRMNKLQPAKHARDWTLDASICANALRCYAGTYYQNEDAPDNEPPNAVVEAVLSKYMLGVAP